MKKDFIGKWRIYAMSEWEKDYFDEDVKAFIKIDSGLCGEFQFGYVSGDIDARIVKQPDGERLELTWEGNDECDDASGSGWMQLKGKNKAEGEFKIHHGDSSTFAARRMR